MFCCIGSRRKGGNERDSVFPEVTDGMRKLTIDHGRVVTAPPTPMRNSFFLASKWSTSKRSTMISMIPDKELEMSFPPTATATSSVIAAPPSPTLSFAPTVASARSTKTRRTSIRRPKLETMQEGTTQDADEDPSSRAASSRSSREAQDAYSTIRAPEPALTSNRNAPTESGRKASLGALSAAVSTGPARTKTSSSSRSKHSRLREVVPVDSSSISSDDDDDKSRRSSGSTSRTSPNTSPNLRPGKFEQEVPSEAEKKDKARKHRPPPITTSRSFSKDKAPTTFLRSPSSTISSISPRTQNPPTAPRTPVSEVQTIRDNRQSVFSVTSSQYSPTASIRPVNQVQIMPARTFRPALVRQPPTTGTRLANIAAASPPISASPKSYFPPNYVVGSSAKQVNASIAGMVTKNIDSPQSYASERDEQGFTTAPTSAVSPKSGHVGSPEFPLTSASLSFPPNLPDYSFTPITEDLPALPPSRKGSAATTASELGTLPEVMPDLPTDASATIEMAASGENMIGSPRSVTTVTSKGMTTIAVSELVGSSPAVKTRQRSAQN